MTPRPPSPGGRPRRGRQLRPLAAMLLALPLLMGASAVPDGGGDAVPVTVQPIAGAATPDTVTLVTGDQVRMQAAGDGRISAVVEAARRADGRQPEFEMVEDGDDLYVIPSDAVTLIPDRLDRELFNVTKLVAYDYTGATPVIMTGAPAQAAASKPTGLSVTVNLPSVGGYAATVTPGGDWWRTIAPTGKAGAKTTAATPAKVWLDELAEVSLAESVPMIGAPQAWASGYDGTGITVAVLDTGIDATHPDLAGKVVEAKNFSTEADTRDGHGHGTHVAGTVVGTGAGSNGKYTGVAPGAKLLIGKICTSSGSCPNSATIAGMEWAASRADVISISIGSSVGNDGNAVTAQAVNNLTRQYDTLFVIAAGNNGAQGPGSIAAPGSADAALTVGAVDKSGRLASFSSRGPRLGDFAIKPDITAPGVAIAAPRAAGTSMGTPVNDLYTSANGTSMATPHVAGAAAIVLQQHPDLSAEALKATLTTAAKQNPDLSVYEQGGGLVDIPAALAAPVRATPAPLNMGFFPYPQTDAAPVGKQVTYTNRTNAAVTLDLTLAVTAPGGAPVPGTALSVEPATLTVPAGGTATATVTLTAAGLALGSYGGYLVADGGGAKVRTPLGFYLEPEMYDVVIEGIDRDGQPAKRGSVHVRHSVNTRFFAKNSLPFNNGLVRLRVPPGPYFVTGTISSIDGENTLAQDRTFVGIPTLQVTGDTTVVLDARKGREMTFAAPAHGTAVPGNSRLGTHFEAEEFGSLTATWLSPWLPTFVLETGPVSVGGGFEMFTNVRLGESPLVTEVVAPERTALHPRPLLGTPVLDADMRLPLVFAGQGAESDYDGIDVTGAVVLTERDGPDLPAKEAAARAHGAKALLVMNRTTGLFGGVVGDAAAIPSMALSGEEGQRLRQLLADGAVTLRVAGTSFSPYLYDLYQVDKGQLPGRPHYVVKPEQMARIDNSFHGQPGQAMADYRAFWRPYMTASFAQYASVTGARKRVEYVTPGDTLYRQSVAAQVPSAAAVVERDTYLERGEHREHHWFKSPLRPTVFEPHGPKNPGDPVVRTDNSIRLVMPEWWDGNVPGHYGYHESGTDSSAFRLYQDGVLLGQAARPRVTINNLPADAHTYRFEVDTARNAEWWTTSTRTTTTWTVRSQRPAAGTAVLPLLLVDYDTEVDLTNTALHPRDRTGPATVGLTIRHQVGADAPAVAGTRVWVSYDDGTTWEQRPVYDRGDGRYQAILDSTDPAEGNGFVTLRVEAWDAAGNRIDQTITRAWRLAER